MPHAARIWNYWLGGTDNVPADRAAGDAVAQATRRSSRWPGWRPDGGPEWLDAYGAVARKL